MPETNCTLEKRWLVLVETGLVAVGMCLFAVFIHCSIPFKLLSVCGLLLATVAILNGLRTEDSPAVVLGIHHFSPAVVVYTAIGFIIGAALGFLYRFDYGFDVHLASLGQFAAIAALIGATEELLYRGYIQGRMRNLGPLLAVTLASLFHTAYKSTLFILPPFPIHIDFTFFSACTFVVGLGLGALRQIGRSVLPPIAAHACFDIIVYGEFSLAPWWVWS